VGEVGAQQDEFDSSPTQTQRAQAFRQCRRRRTTNGQRLAPKFLLRIKSREFVRSLLPQWAKLTVHAAIKFSEEPR
jgi:hypothetical protein